MKLNSLKPSPGSKKVRRRLGRGLGSGRGKTAGRGQKGQKSRSGFSSGSGWEGGRSRLIMRLPKRGFNRKKDAFQIVNLFDLNRFGNGAVVSAQTLAETGLVRRSDRAVKILGQGKLEVKELIIEVDACSRGALAALRAADCRVAEDVSQDESGTEESA